MKIIEVGLVSGKVFETANAQVLVYVDHIEIEYRAGGSKIRIPRHAIAYVTLSPGKVPGCEGCIFNQEEREDGSDV